MIQPSQPPELVSPRTREAQLARPFMACWINSVGRPTILTPNGCHLRKTAYAAIRKAMNDGSDHRVNHHTMYYVWDTSWPTWQPANPYCWTPVAERPRDQWVPSYIPTDASV